MNSGTRLIHDLHTQLRNALGGKPAMVEPPPEKDLIDSGIIQEAGTANLPNPLESSMHRHEPETVTYNWDEARYYRIRKAYLVGDNAQIFLPDGRFFIGCLHPQQHLVERMKIRRPIPMLAKRIEGPVFHLSGRNHENVGHFMLQHLPRLIAARDLLKDIGDYRILVAPGHARWQRRLIEVLGFDGERVIEGSQGTLLVEDLIHVPFLYGSNALSSPELCRAIRDHAARSAPEVVPGKPLFISRSDAPDKRLENEEEIIKAAESVFGEIEVFTFRGKTLPDKVRIFRNAPVIIGPIGQGVCNMIFVEGRPLITLVPGEAENQTYTNSHSTHLCLACDNPAVTLYNGIKGASRGNWTFPVEEFRKQLDRLVAHPLMSHLDIRS